MRSATSSFPERLVELPHLGLGVSTEYGARAAGRGLDPAELRRMHPQFAQFLEIGVETAKGLDADAEAWAAAGHPCSYHFLDINLDDPEDFDARWIGELQEFIERLRPAWLCGDAGLWHFGRRERGHMLLLPPILSDDAASAMAEGIVRLREATGLEVLPENPPGAVYVGELHLLDYYARCCERADSGMLLDCAHLAIYQRTMGHEPLTGLDDFPLDRIVEMHVAGGKRREHRGYEYYEDDHAPTVLPATWEIFDYVAARASQLRAVVFECERNPIAECLPGFERIRSILRERAGWA